MTLSAFLIDNMTFYLHFCTDALLRNKDGDLFPPKRPRALAENAFSKVRNGKQGAYQGTLCPNERLGM